MDEAAASAVLSALPKLAERPFQRLRSQLPPTAPVIGPAVDHFTLSGAGRDAGVAMQLTVSRGDGRRISWLVEAWRYPTGPGEWAVNVKAEIDLDELDGGDRCVLNEEQTVHDGGGGLVAVAGAVEQVVSHPRTDLLTDGWQPSWWSEG